MKKAKGLKEYQVSVDASGYIVVKAESESDARDKVDGMSHTKLLNAIEDNIEVGSSIDCLEGEEE